MLLFLMPAEVSRYFMAFHLTYPTGAERLEHPLQLPTKLFGQRDNHALGAAKVAEAIRIPVLYHLAHEFRPMFLQASNDVINVDISPKQHPTSS